VYVIRYNCITFALVVSRKSDSSWSKTFAMYMFQQFYKEFTPDLLTDFFGNDKLKLNKLFEKVNEIKINDGKMNE
jgi:hypothetical protein